MIEEYLTLFVLTLIRLIFCIILGSTVAIIFLYPLLFCFIDSRRLFTIPLAFTPLKPKADTKFHAHLYVPHSEPVLSESNWSFSA